MLQVVDIFYNLCHAFDKNMFSYIVFCDISKAFDRVLHIVGQICNNFKKNRAFYDKSMKLGTCIVYNNTK